MVVLTGVEGRRRYPDESGRMPPMHEGDYGCFDGKWYGFAPGAGLGSLEDHEVQEHSDGTISVNPSIVYDRPFLFDETGAGKHWHGYLDHGVWRES